MPSASHFSIIMRKKNSWWNLQEKQEKNLPSEMFLKRSEKNKSFLSLFFPPSRTHFLMLLVKRKTFSGFGKNNCCFPSLRVLFKTFFLMFTFLISFHLEVFRIILKRKFLTKEFCAGLLDFLDFTLRFYIVWVLRL